MPILNKGFLPPSRVNIDNLKKLSEDFRPNHCSFSLALNIDSSPEAIYAAGAKLTMDLKRFSESGFTDESIGLKPITISFFKE